MFRATDKGKKRLKKVDSGFKDRAEEIFDEAYRELRGLEPMDEEIKENLNDIIFVLKIIANKTDQKELKSKLKDEYFNEFSYKETAHFNYVWSILERKRLVEQSCGVTGYGGGYSELPFYIKDKGQRLYNDEKWKWR